MGIYQRAYDIAVRASQAAAQCEDGSPEQERANAAFDRAMALANATVAMMPGGATGFTDPETGAWVTCAADCDGWV